MKKLWKRNAVVAGVLVLVCAAIVLNGRYAGKVEESKKVLGQSTLVSAAGEDEAAEVSTEVTPVVSDYFATARLTRRQARDNALSMLQEASASEITDAQVMRELTESIEALASSTLAEAQIENMITAKGYDDCVVFLSADSVSVVVAAREGGLQTGDVAKITDIVKQETGLASSAIKIVEVG